MTPSRGKRVKVKGLTLYVEEYDHAYLVRGPGVSGGALTVAIGRLAVFEFLGRKKWTRINSMPCRPLSTKELGEEPSCSAIAFYFNIGQTCSEPCRCCSARGNEYKP